MADAAHTLVIFRHAKSDRPAGVADHDRGLAKRGRRDATAAGRWLREHLGVPDLVVCSPAARALETWEVAVGELAAAPPLEQDERIYDATSDTLLEVVRDQPDRAETVVLVGHNPGLEDLVELLTGKADELKTSAVAVLRLPAGWADAAVGSARLDTLAVPRG